MIRSAAPADIPAIVGMAVALARATRMPIEVDAQWTAAFLGRLLLHPDGFARVVDRGAGPVGMLIASVGQVPVSPARVASECGWWCGPDARGWGIRLLDAYVAWARESGCAFARMSTGPDAADPVNGPARLLCARGWVIAEHAWIMRL